MARRGRQVNKAPVEVRWGRLGALVLLIVGAYLYVSPLRAFFAQQDRYAQAVAALHQAQKQHALIEDQLAKLDTKAYVVRRARQDFQLVPAGMQVFAIPALHSAPESLRLTIDENPPPVPHLSLAERFTDLWHTVLK